MNIQEILKDCGALLDGHFKLTSGRHSNRYIDKMMILKYPRYAEMIGKELAKPYKDDKIDVVVGPAMGGIILAHEAGKELNTKTYFSHRDKNGIMCFRPSFQFNKNDRVLLVEDIVTTGGSVFELIELVKQYEVKIVGISIIVDRSGGKIDFGYPTISLLTLNIESFLPEECPLCSGGVPFTILGSTGK